MRDIFSILSKTLIHTQWISCHFIGWDHLLQRIQTGLYLSLYQWFSPRWVQEFLIFLDQPVLPTNKRRLPCPHWVVVNSCEGPSDLTSSPLFPEMAILLTFSGPIPKRLCSSWALLIDIPFEYSRSRTTCGIIAGEGISDPISCFFRKSPRLA